MMMKRIGTGLLLVATIALGSCDVAEMMMGLPMNGGTGTGGEEDPVNDDTGGGDQDDPLLQEVMVASDSFILAWEDQDPESVDSYVVFYRPHGSVDWQELTTVDSEAGVQCLIDESILSKGSWDFGVVAIQIGGDEGVMHTSLDATAVPSMGWFLVWT